MKFINWLWLKTLGRTHKTEPCARPEWHEDECGPAEPEDDPDMDIATMARLRMEQLKSDELRDL